MAQSYVEHTAGKISADNIYQLLLAFDKLYDTFSEVEQRDFMRAFIERIDIYPEKPENGCWIRNIVFNFPMPVPWKGDENSALGIAVNGVGGVLTF